MSKHYIYINANNLLYGLKKACVDLNINCVSWAAKGECTRNSQFMSLECRQSCNLCDERKAEKLTTRKIPETTYIDLAGF